MEEEEAGWAADQIMTLWREILLPGLELRFLGCLGPNLSHYTGYSVPCALDTQHDFHLCYKVKTTLTKAKLPATRKCFVITPEK